MDRLTLERALAEAKRGLSQAQADQAALADANQRAHDFGLAVQGLTAWLNRMGPATENAKGSRGAESPEIQLGHVNGEVPPKVVTDTTFVKPKDAIMRLVSEQPRDWPLAEIVRTMLDRRWLDPSLSRPIEAVRAAANRLVDVDHELERTGVSTYRRSQTAKFKFTIGEGQA